MLARRLVLLALGLGSASTGCAVSRAPATPGSLGSIAGELDALAGPEVRSYGAVFRSVLEDALDKDEFVCAPTPHDVFFSRAPEGARVIRGAMPHYGVWFAPMRYEVRRGAGAWRVAVNVRVEPPPEGALLELPDCALAGRVDGPRAGPRARAGESEAPICPSSRVFAARATTRTVQALLERWSTEVERYFNRDAAAFGLPVTYDFEFFLDEDARGRRVDLSLPLATTCGRTPYFAAASSGWSLPVLAHEMGHVLGLLDEFEDVGEMLGIAYTSPSGLELSRMGESRTEASMVLPLHHYLVLRRFFCPEPAAADPYSGARL